MSPDLPPDSSHSVPAADEWLARRWGALHPPKGTDPWGHPGGRADAVRGAETGCGSELGYPLALQKGLTSEAQVAV